MGCMHCVRTEGRTAGLRPAPRAQYCRVEGLSVCVAAYTTHLVCACKLDQMNLLRVCI